MTTLTTDQAITATIAVTTIYFILIWKGNRIMKILGSILILIVGAIGTVSITDNLEQIAMATIAATGLITLVYQASMTATATFNHNSH